MIENIEQAKERLKGIVDFYKLNDPNNYDYNDRDLISMKLVLEEIERLNNIINKAIEYIKEDMYVEPTELYGLVDGEHLLNILQGSDKE